MGLSLLALLGVGCSKLHALNRFETGGVWELSSVCTSDGESCWGLDFYVRQMAQVPYDTILSKNIDPLLGDMASFRFTEDGATETFTWYGACQSCLYSKTRNLGRLQAVGSAVVATQENDAHTQITVQMLSTTNSRLQTMMNLQGNNTFTIFRQKAQSGADLLVVPCVFYFDDARMMTCVYQRYD